MSTENPGGGAGALSVEALIESLLFQFDLKSMLLLKTYLNERTRLEGVMLVVFAVKELGMVDAKQRQQKGSTLKMFILPDNMWFSSARPEEGWQFIKLWSWMLNSKMRLFRAGIATTPLLATREDAVIICTYSQGGNRNNILSWAVVIDLP